VVSELKASRTGSVLELSQVSFEAFVDCSSIGMLFGVFLTKGGGSSSES